jgi:hypothetical protein
MQRKGGTAGVDATGLDGVFCTPLQARNAAIANGYFTAAINRVGTEVGVARLICRDQSQLDVLFFM